jgi:hypothetical protein
MSAVMRRAALANITGPVVDVIRGGRAFKPAGIPG